MVVFTPVDEEDIPLMNAPAEQDSEVHEVDWDNAGDADKGSDAQDGFSNGGEDGAFEYVSDDGGGESGDDPEEERRRHEPDEEGKYRDDPLWWGKTLVEIRRCTDDAKTEGNKAHGEGDQVAANRHWKNALKGAHKLEDCETEFRLRLNLAMGYTKLGKTNKALYHCSEALCDSLRSSVPQALQAKAHYRRAEALQASGEVENALVSVKAALQIEPGNVDMRHKQAELKGLEQEHRKREKALFAGKQLLQAMSDGKTDPPQASSNAEEDEEIRAAEERRRRYEEAQETAAVEAEEAEASENDEDDAGGEAEQDAEAVSFDVSSLTDRAQANKLVEKINGGGYGGCIDYVGKPMSFYGPANLQEEESESH